MPIEKTLYDSVGGDAGLDRLTAAFIRVLLDDPQLEELRSIYAGRDLAHYEARLKEFLSGWLGGPPLYLERHGMPMLREGHRRLVITQNARYQWMSAMRSALAKRYPILKSAFVLKEPSPKWLNHSSIQIAENTSKTPHVSDNMRRFLIHSGPTFILTLEPLGINL